MTDTEQQFLEYPLAFDVGQPSLTWYADWPILGGEGQVATGSYTVLTPISITLA